MSITSEKTKRRVKKRIRSLRQIPQAKGTRRSKHRRVPRALWLPALIGASGIGAWGLSQRLRPTPMPATLAFLLDSRLVATVAGPDLLLERADIRPGMRVLDAGCGPGRISLPLAERVGPHGRVRAVDGQESMLEKLRSLLDASGHTNVTPVRAELGADELPAGEAFDRVMLNMVMGEIRQRRRAFEDLYSALAPGGILSVTETLEPDYRRRATVRRELEAAGFVFERVYGGWISYTMNFKKPLP